MENIIIRKSFAGVQDVNMMLAPLLQPLNALDYHFIVLHDTGDDGVLQYEGPVLLEVDQVQREPEFHVEQLQPRHALAVDLRHYLVAGVGQVHYARVKGVHRNVRDQVNIRVLGLGSIVERTM